MIEESEDRPAAYYIYADRVRQAPRKAGVSLKASANEGSADRAKSSAVISTANKKGGVSRVSSVMSSEMTMPKDSVISVSERTLGGMPNQKKEEGGAPPETPTIELDD